MKWVRTANGNWLNLRQVERVDSVDDGVVAVFVDGREVRLHDDAVNTLTETVVPALPGYTIHFWDEDGMVRIGEPVVAWLVDVSNPGYAPIPVGDFSGDIRGVEMAYAIKRPDGTWMIPGDTEYEDRDAVEKAIARFNAAGTKLKG